MFCTKCGANNPEDAKFCFACGTTIHVAAAPSVVTAPAPASVGAVPKADTASATSGAEPLTRRVSAKRCPSCNLPNRENAERCACGHVFDQSAGSGPTVATRAISPKEPARPGLVTALAVLDLIGGGFLAVMFVLCFGILVFGEPGDSALPFFLSTVLFGGLSAVQIACGIGLWKLKPYGRMIQLVFSWIGLLAFPLGTVISILVLVYLNKPGIRLLFSGKASSELTPDELQQVFTATQGGGITTALVAGLIVLVAIAVVGIIAAIAVPGLLRARIAGNEASAIGSIRAVNSAQGAFAASCANGLYARSLNVLGIGPSGGSAFISPDLGASASATKSGYTVMMTGTAAVGTACNGATNMASDYQVLAVPISTSTGTRMFCSDQTGIIREEAASSGSDATAIACPTAWSPVQ